jgi:hypothetical protein
VPRSGDADQPALAGPRFSAWSTAQKVDEIADNHADVNTDSLDGCPIESPNGPSLVRLPAEAEEKKDPQISGIARQ